MNDDHNYKCVYNYVQCMWDCRQNGTFTKKQPSESLKSKLMVTVVRFLICFINVIWCGFPLSSSSCLATLNWPKVWMSVIMEPVMDWCLIRGIFPPMDPDNEKEFTEDEWMNEHHLTEHLILIVLFTVILIIHTVALVNR